MTDTRDEGRGPYAVRCHPMNAKDYLRPERFPFKALAENMAKQYEELGLRCTVEEVASDD